MSLFTSPHFASAIASGTDWRDTSKTILEQLEGIKTDGNNFNFGFLYISDHLVSDAVSILNLFRSVLGIENWVGTVGLGVCGNGESYVDVPAISAMIGHFDEESFCVFPRIQNSSDHSAPDLESWLETNDPMLVFVHGNPISEEDPAQTIEALEQQTNGFLLGGLSSSRQDHIQFAGELSEEDISGVAFAAEIPVATTLSQGCNPFSPMHTITKGGGHVLLELDSEKATTVFENDLRSMAMKKIERDPNTIMIDEKALHDVEAVPEEFRSLFKGEVHAAFPVKGSDQNDYLVRNITGLDPEEGSMMLTQEIQSGETLMFVHRNDETVQEDLSKSLLDLRERVKKDTGEFAPKAALYVSCVARAFSDSQDDASADEMKLIRDIIGDVPLAGFYAGGEISKARLYGYTGVLTLFL